MKRDPVKAREWRMRSRRLRPVSPKRALEQRERRKLVESYSTRPMCPVNWDNGCTRLADDLHEPLLRSRGGDPSSAEDTIPICRHCHDRVHQFPREATKRGWMIPSWEAR